MSLYNDLTTVLTPYASKIKRNESDIGDIQDALDHLDVETDKTLSVDGKPADAKKAGDEITAIKADLGDLNEFCYKEIVDITTGSRSVTSGTEINKNLALVNCDIPSGTTYKFTLNANGCIGTFYLYANGSRIRNDCVSETAYEFTASERITAIGIYANAANVIGTGTITGVISIATPTEDSLEERIGTLSGLDTTDKSNLVSAINEVKADLSESVPDLKSALNSLPDIIVKTKTEIARITYTDQYINDNGVIKNNSSYKLSSYIETYGNKVRVENTNSGVALYIVEFNSSHEILRRHHQYNATYIETEGSCAFVRFYAYENSGGIDTSKLTAFWINDESVETQIGSLDAQKIQVENLMSNTKLLYHVDSIPIGAEINNESGNTTFIYKNVISALAVEEGDSITVKIDKIQNNIQNKCVYCYFRDRESSLVKQVNVGITETYNGINLKVPSGATKFGLKLYPSISGGLTTEPALFTNVNVLLTKGSATSIIQKYTETVFPVPSYYLEDGYIEGKMSDIFDCMETAEGMFDAFIFITDLHWSLNTRKSPSLIEYVSKRFPMPRMFVGGDIEDGINVDANNMLKRAFKGKIYNVNGNHEYMNSIVIDDIRNSSFTVTGGTIWTYNHQHMTDCMLGDPERGYYYVDNTVQKIRYIVLSDFKDGPTSEWETTQKEWLQAVLSAMQNYWTAIIFVHAVSSVNRETGALTKNYIFTDLEAIVDGYSGGGEIAAIIAGHTHFDGLGSTDGGVPVFITACDKMYPYPGDDDFLSNYRTENTITEQAFDVFVVDKTNKKVSAIRIGCPANNPAGDPLEIRVASYGT